MGQGHTLHPMNSRSPSGNGESASRSKRRRPVRDKSDWGGVGGGGGFAGGVDVLLCQFIESKLRAPVAPAGPTRPIHLPPDNGSGGPIPPGGSVITFPPPLTRPG